MKQTFGVDVNYGKLHKEQFRRKEKKSRRYAKWGRGEAGIIVETKQW